MTTTGAPAAPPGPDRPKVPKSGMSWLVRIYLALSATVLAVFMAAGFLGWDFADGKNAQAPGSARQSPGGYRAYHFWHTGYQGGK